MTQRGIVENHVTMLKTRLTLTEQGPKLRAPGGRWRPSLGEAGPHQVLPSKQKKCFFVF